MGDRGSNRRIQPTGGDGLLLWGGIALTLAVLALAWGAVQLGHRWAGIRSSDTPANPWAVLFGVLSGDVVWPVESTVVVVAAVGLLVAFGWLLWVRSRGRKRGRSRVDWTASVLGQGDEIAPITASGAASTASRLGVTHTSPGLPIGRTTGTNAMLYGTWEDTQVDIWGPRTGKTTCRAIPAIMAAPGAVLVTSNKRDVVDATRHPRSEQGSVWVFDPQGLAGEDPGWWWNPLSYVTDEVKAATLADHFGTGSRDPNARTDSYFDPAGRDLLAGLLLAAACEGLPITAVYQWVTRPHDDEPARILGRHGYPLIQEGVAGVVALTERQRDGIYGTAKQMIACLTNRAVLAWVTDDGSGRPEFDPHAFVAGNSTLYSLSREGRGTAGPLVTALTVATIEAAEDLATRQAGGRLRMPLVAVLDEAANVCRWRDLPDLYSHYGSRGIVLLTILQSWSQGVEVWGEHGMNKLWSAANVAVYGGGSKEEAFLSRLSRLVGTYDKQTRSVSVSHGSAGRPSSRQTSHQLQNEAIFGVDDLSALPRGRALVLASGARPTLINTVPWMDTKHAGAIRESIARHDPGHQRDHPDDKAAAVLDLGSDSSVWVRAAKKDR